MAGISKGLWPITYGYALLDPYLSTHLPLGDPLMDGWPLRSAACVLVQRACERLANLRILCLHDVTGDGGGAIQTKKWSAVSARGHALPAMAPPQHACVHASIHPRMGVLSPCLAAAFRDTPSPAAPGAQVLRAVHRAAVQALSGVRSLMSVELRIPDTLHTWSCLLLRYRGMLQVHEMPDVM